MDPQTDYLDLYQLQQEDETTPLDETLGTFAALIQQGKVRAIGACSAPGRRQGQQGSRRCLGKPRNIDIDYLLHSQCQFVVSCLRKKCRNALTNHLYFEMPQ